MLVFIRAPYRSRPATNFINQSLWYPNPPISISHVTCPDVRKFRARDMGAHNRKFFTTLLYL